MWSKYLLVLLVGCSHTPTIQECQGNLECLKDVQRHKIYKDCINNFYRQYSSIDMQRVGWYLEPPNHACRKIAKAAVP